MPKRVAQAEAKTVATLREQAETAAAREIRAIRALASLVARVRRTGGHATPQEQHALWEAEALLAEVSGTGRRT